MVDVRGLGARPYDVAPPGRGSLRNIIPAPYYLIHFDMRFFEIISGIDLGIHACRDAGRMVEQEI